MLLPSSRIHNEGSRHSKGDAACLSLGESSAINVKENQSTITSNKVVEVDLSPKRPLKTVRWPVYWRNAAGISLVLIAWQALSSAGWINPQLLPGPIQIFSTMLELLRDGTLLSNAAASLQRVCIGFLLAALVGLVLGVLLGWSRLLDDLLHPIFETLRPIPPIAWTPIAILWFGIGNAPSYFLVFIGAVFPVLVNTYSAVRNIDRNQINAALCLGANTRLLIFEILIPASLPVIFPGLRIALGVGWMCVVAAELIAAQSGLGYLIQTSRLLLQTSAVLVGMITIGMIGFAMNGVMSWIEYKLVSWQVSARPPA